MHANHVQLSFDVLSEKCTDKIDHLLQRDTQAVVTETDEPYRWTDVSQRPKCVFGNEVRSVVDKSQRDSLPFELSWKKGSGSACFMPPRSLHPYYFNCFSAAGAEDRSCTAVRPSISAAVRPLQPLASLSAVAAARRSAGCIALAHRYRYRDRYL
jgi:D-alanyl-D-alanine carboxypeptidase